MVNQCETKYRSTSCIEHKGKTLTVRDWAKEIGMHYNSLLSRLNSGMSIESAIETPVNIKRQNSGKASSKKYEYNGKLYTMSELSEMSGICDITLLDRIRKGWSIKSAVETPVISPKLYEYNGKKYTIKELAKKVGIRLTTLYTRLSRNWPLEEALGIKERTQVSNKKENNKMLSTDTTKVTLHEDRSCTIPVVWTEAEDEIIKKGIRESIPLSTLYQMLGGKHSADSIELRKAVLMKSMGMVYNTAVDEKQEYTMRDIVAFIYPNIDGTYTQNKEYKRAVGRIRPLLRSLKLDRNVITKNTSEKHYKLTTAELNKVRNRIYKKYPEGIKSKIIYNNTSNSEEVVVCTIKNPNTGNAEPAITYNPNTNTETYHVTKYDVYADKEETQQLFNVQQQYKNQIKQLNEFLVKLQQDNNTEIKGLKIHMSDNCVKLFVTWN